MTGKTKVWTSEAWGRTNYLKFISYDDEPHSAEMCRKFKRGAQIDPDWFPRKVYLENLGVKPTEIFSIRGFLVLVSERFVELLGNFDLGSNQLVETALYESARQSKLPMRFFVFNIVEKKTDCFVPNESKGPFDNIGGDFFWTAPNGYDGIAVRESAVIDGVDVWMDPILGQTPFFSGPLGDAIKKGKFGRTGLKPCVVLS
ncbi:hypothetical protein ABVF61_07980 [Roseibium sp. HPY-6]|uniref:hypothetical protein n=1 Tax=Roseibium sp. HPY-6 TaxID=3229852 RepID=UPI00338E8B6D